jgi:hypothetical protein
LFQSATQSRIPHLPDGALSLPISAFLRHRW